MEPNMNVGGSQDFRLTWVNYSQKLTESFHKFLTSEILCNVTLWVHESGVGGGTSIKAHQAILSACSPWFEKILSQNQHPHPIIILKDVRYHDLKNIIRFIYTGEVFVPQHDLQDFLRTAELLEIKGLLKDDAAWPPQGLASLFQAPVSPGPSQKQQQQQQQQQHGLPTLPTVPVSSFLLPTGNTTSIVSGHINEGTQIHDLVSQIKVPVTLPSQPVSKTLLTTNPASVIGTSVGTGGGIGVSPGGEKRRKIEIINRRTPVTVTTSTGSNNGGIAIVNSGPPASTIQSHNNTKTRRLLTTSTNAVTTQIVVEDASGHSGGPMMSQASVEEDGVSWIDDTGGPSCTENVSTMDSANLTPAEWVATGINDCGAFKRVWAERYLCYNLGREIICLLCFCRFTQFKKFNLERHMKNKHPQMYSLNETARREILEQFVARYIDHVSPENSVNHSSGTPGGQGPSGAQGTPGTGGDHRSHDVASEILAIGPIQVEGINIDTSQTTSDSSLHEIKVEETTNDGSGVGVVGPGGPGGPGSKDRGGGHPSDNIMVELGEPDSEMLLVK